MTTRVSHTTESFPDAVRTCIIYSASFDLCAIKLGRLRLFEHVKRREESNWVKRCMNLEIEGRNPKGCPKLVDLETGRKRGFEVDGCGRGGGGG